MPRWKRFSASVILCELAAAIAGLLVVPQTAQAQIAFDVVHAFAGSPSDGALNLGGLVEAGDGTLYGVTFGGGQFGVGTIFQTAADGTTTILHNFANGADGYRPTGPLVLAGDGSLYMLGSAFLPGTLTARNAVLKRTPDGAVTAFVVSTSPSGPDGYDLSSLVLAHDGNLYGTAQSGGISPLAGTAFMITPIGVVTLLKSFAATSADLKDPMSLIQASDGTFYGMGFVNLVPTVFKMTTDGTPAGTTVSPMGSIPNGGGYEADVILATDGNFYGLTGTALRSSACAPPACGVFFTMSPQGNVTILHTFAQADGATPGGLLEGGDGNFYGVGPVAGAGFGTLFEVTSSGALTVLHSFTGGADGKGPGDSASPGYSPGAIIQASDGSFYGTASGGGSLGFGTLFRLHFNNTPVGTDISVAPADQNGHAGAVAVTFSNVDTAGNTTMTTGSTAPAVPSGFQLGTPAIFYDVTTTALFSGTVHVCVNDGAVTFGGTDLHLLHFENGSWVDVTTTVDSSAHVICGTTTSLSPFAVVVRLDQTPPVANPVPTTAANATGWYNAPVTVNWNWTDTGTGVDSSHCTTSSTSSGEGSITVTASCQDLAGNIGTATFIVNVDTAPPVVTVPASVTVDAALVTGAAVTFSASASDLVAGPVAVVCAPASGSIFLLGTTTVTCSASDGHGNTAAASFSVTVNDPVTPGRMEGDGTVSAGGVRYGFDFSVRERPPAGVDRGHLSVVVRDGRNREVGKLESTSLDDVIFADNPAFKPGHGAKPTVDSVSMQGHGKWNGQAGYTFVVEATDQGEPGRGRDHFSGMVRDAAGGIVLSVDGVLSDGNIQSSRLGR